MTWNLCVFVHTNQLRVAPSIHFLLIIRWNFEIRDLICRIIRKYKNYQTNFLNPWFVKNLPNNIFKGGWRRKWEEVPCSNLPNNILKKIIKLTFSYRNTFLLLDLKKVSDHDNSNFLQFKKWLISISNVSTMTSITSFYNTDFNKLKYYRHNPVAYC